MKRFTSFILVLAILSTFMLSGCSTKNPLKQMSLQDKITQMMMVDFLCWDEDPDDEIDAESFTVMNSQVQEILGKYHFGAVIYFAQNLKDTEQSFNLTLAIQESSVAGGGLPLLIAADQEGGSVYRLATGTALPGNMALTATGSLENAKLSGRIIGRELNALGINVDLAPVVDVNNNAANPVIGLRAYSDLPAVVGDMASATIDGLRESQIIACAKHFPGHGNTASDSHYSLPCVDKSLEELMACELQPFTTVIDQGIDMIMAAHILYPQLDQTKVLSQKTGQEESLPATMSKKILTELLKETMGFDGIVVTDAMNMAGITDYWDPVQASVLAIQAGADMLCMPCSVYSCEDLEQLDAIIQGIMHAVENGSIPIARIDDAVSRILAVKEKYGILDWSANKHTLEQAMEIVGNASHREDERIMAASAVTVVENKNQTLPLQITAETKCLMLVPYDNEKAQMILGWNRAAEAGLIPEGAEVQVVRFSKDTAPDTFQSEIDWADTLIFNSEISQAARMHGGRWESSYILDVIAYAEEQGKTTIVQSVDKPYDVQSYPDADAVLAVYGCKGSSLDPTEVLVGGTVASDQAFGPNIVAGIEVILGVFGAEGVLPVDIPKYGNGSFTNEILYPRGYGIHYSSLLS